MANSTCSIEGCDRPSRRRGWCSMHYTRWYVQGDPLKLGDKGSRRRPMVDRFWHRVDKRPDGCWMWTGCLNGWGYGTIGKDGGRGAGQTLTHRYAYELLVGPVPEGMDLDHMCHNRDRSCPAGRLCKHRACCNPDHLLVATRSENLKRGQSGRKPHPR